MGSINSQSSLYPSTINPEQWIQVKLNVRNHKAIHGNFICFENKNTHHQIDKYQLQFSTKKQQSDYYDVYLKRRQHQKIVNSIHYTDLRKRQYCSHTYKSEVYIEHIPLRLADFTDIPYPDNLYILKNSLQGFAYLYQCFGYFQIEQDHICINNLGQLKVWLNCNLSKNNHEEQFQQSIKSEHDMVNRIIYLIQINTNPTNCPLAVTKYFSHNYVKCPNFITAIQIIEQFAKDYKTIIPQKCQSILQIFNNDNDVNSILNASMLSLNQKVGNQFMEVNGIRIPSLSIRDSRKNIKIQTKQQRKSNKSKSSKNSRGSSIKSRHSLTKNKNDYQKHSPVEFSHIKKYDSKTNRLSTLYTQRLDLRRRRSITKRKNSIEEKNVRKSLKNNIQQSKQKKMVHFNKLETKRTPVKQNNEQLNKISPKNQIRTVNCINKTSVRPVVNFTYTSPLNQVKQLQALQISNQIETLQVETKNLLENTNNGVKMGLCYYDTGTGSEQIDPQIAADLLKYL